MWTARTQRVRAAQGLASTNTKPSLRVRVRAIIYNTLSEMNSTYHPPTPTTDINNI